MSTDLNGFLDGVDYPMFVVTATHDGEHAGCLVGFATQVSIHPARLLVGLSVANHTYRVAREATTLGVHLLSRNQTELAALFGGETGDEIDKFTRCHWAEGPHGVRVLGGVTGWMVGSVLEQVPLGDHVGFLLDPLECQRENTGDVLMFRQVMGLSPGHPA
ncbi:flavin reductase family protein [Parafrigoribacterium mesophilum]|uniref:flavin reductase family protein n=1 Tax=Parafrigoribacterium mesophilum TaxID=433646 RepID=UPI0031FCF7E7